MVVCDGGLSTALHRSDADRMDVRHVGVGRTPPGSTSILQDAY